MSIKEKLALEVKLARAVRARDVARRRLYLYLLGRARCL